MELVIELDANVNSSLVRGVVESTQPIYAVGRPREYSILRKSE